MERSESPSREDTPCPPYTKHPIDTYRNGKKSLELKSPPLQESGSLALQEAEPDPGCCYIITRFCSGKHNESSEQDKITSSTELTKLYKRRYWMLFLFSMTSMVNAMQWLQYSDIMEVVMCYYDVSDFAVDWTSLVYMLVYVPLVFPVSWFLDRYDVRVTLLMGSFITCASTIVQSFAQNSNGFTMVIVAQALSGVGQVFILPIPPKLSSVWFGPKEVCRATAIGVLGNQIGIAAGFLFTPLLVSSECSNKELIKHGIGLVAYILVGINAIIFTLLLLTFENKPPKPPSLGEAAKVRVKTNYKESICALLKNFNFDLLLISYGLIVGVGFAIETLLSPMVSVTYKDAQAEIGELGAVLIIMGLFGSIVAGYVLDWTLKFKETSVVIFVCSLVSAAAFAGCLFIKRSWLLFMTGSTMGFFLAGYLPVGFEFATELTYPESEGTTAGLLNAATMAFGVIATILGSHLLDNYGLMAPNLFFCGILFLGCILIACIKPELRRTESNMQNFTHQPEKLKEKV